MSEDPTALQASPAALEILYRDDHYIAIHKPDGIHVHPTGLSRGEVSCMQLLRNQTGSWVYTIHRLDRATSGVLLFACSAEAAKRMHELFVQRQVNKRYLAVVRGYPDAPEGVIDYALRESQDREPQQAQTAFRRLARAELPYPVSKYPTARFSLLEAFPRSGRRHQIRKHFAHLRHPVIGDVTYGDGRQNRFFREHFQLPRLLLLATHLQFRHPFTGELMQIEAHLPEGVQALFAQLNWLEQACFNGYIT